jgi:preprotein translocase subunit SecF
VVDLFRGRKWDLVGLRNLWFAISLLVIIPGIIFWATRGLNYGIDFTGGGLITYKLAQPVAGGTDTDVLAKARAAITSTGIEARVQIAGTAAGKDQLLVRTLIRKQAGKSEEEVRTDQQTRIEAALSGPFPGIHTVAAEMVTPVVSKELLMNAVWSVVAGMVFILLWVWLRYHGWKWGGTALVALVHDVLVLIGAFAMSYREINSPFVAAALTVVGFSVHDTIVIFDRIRENLRLRKGATFAETANISLLETLARSVNTVLTVEFVLVAVYLLGGVSLRDFTFAMIVGVTVGAYSSIFNASQLMVVMRNREERALARQRALAGRAAAGAGRGARPAARPVSTSAPAPRPVTPRAQSEPMPDAGGLAATPAPVAGGDPGSRVPRDARRKLRAGRKRKKRF